jgi:hypothetical protein
MKTMLSILTKGKFMKSTVQASTLNFLGIKKTRMGDFSIGKYALSA